MDVPYFPQKKLLSDLSKKDGSNQNKSAYKLVCPNDIAYNKMRAWQGAVGVSNFRGIVSPAYVIMRLREINNPRYFHHLFRTPHFAKEDIVVSEVTHPSPLRSQQDVTGDQDQENNVTWFAKSVTIRKGKLMKLWNSDSPLPRFSTSPLPPASGTSFS